MSLVSLNKNLFYMIASYLDNKSLSKFLRLNKKMNEYRNHEIVEKIFQKNLSQTELFQKLLSTNAPKEAFQKYKIKISGKINFQKHFLRKSWNPPASIEDPTFFETVPHANRLIMINEIEKTIREERNKNSKLTTYDVKVNFIYLPVEDGFANPILKTDSRNYFEFNNTIYIVNKFFKSEKFVEFPSIRKLPGTQFVDICILNEIDCGVSLHCNEEEQKYFLALWDIETCIVLSHFSSNHIISNPGGLSTDGKTIYLFSNNLQEKIAENSIFYSEFKKK